MAAQKHKKQKQMAKLAHEKTAVHRLHLVQKFLLILILLCVCLFADYNVDTIKVTVCGSVVGSTTPVFFCPQITLQKDNESPDS